jgi:tetratricopeptide (TPR) repeat protein
MPLRPKHTPVASRPSAQRQFTDREDFIQVFRAALAGNRPDQHQVLVYYGVGGIGKTTLRRELERLAAEQDGVVSAALDFETPGFRDMETALFALRKSLLGDFKVHFPTFDIAYAAYWQKSRPQASMTGDNLSLLQDSMVLSDLLAAVGMVPIIGVIPRLPYLFARGRKVLQDWWTRRGSRELKELPALEPQGIAERLPMFWAADLRDYLNQQQKTAVVFLDTYDALAEAERVEGKLREREAWVRELVAQLSEVLWVICGREQLRWEETDKEWAGALRQHLIGGLSDNDARQFLTGCGIDDPAVQSAVVTSSQGVPYFLDLAVDTWVEIKERHNRIPKPDDFAHTRLEMFDRFLRHLTHPEVETLKVLSVPRFWDYPLCEALVTKFQTGFSLTAFADLCRFSFIDQDPASGLWRMHQLMRQSLQEHQAPELKERVQRFLFDHYAGQLQDISPSHVTEAHVRAFVEADYHGSRVVEPGDFLEWCNHVLTCMDRVGQWRRLLLSLAQERYQVLTARLGPDHPIVVRTLANLGTCYMNLGDVRSAEPVLREALARGEKALDADSEPFVRILCGLAVLLGMKGRGGECELLFERALAIQRRMTAPDRVLLAGTLSRLANLYNDRSRFGDADAAFQEAIATLRGAAESDGADSYAQAELLLPGFLQSYGNFCLDQGRLDEAERLSREALEIAERAQVPDRMMGGLLNARGLHLLRVGRYDESEPFLRRALALTEGSAGPDDPWLASGPLDSLAELCRLQGRLDESEQLHRRSLGILENASGPWHLHVALPLYGLAEIRLAQGNFDEAEALFKRALGIRENVLPAGHPETARVLDGLARLYEQTGRAAEAQAIRDRLQAIKGKREIGGDAPLV